MKQKLKRFMAGFMAMLTLVGTLFTNGTTAFAASPQANIAFWNASVKNSGEVSELKPGYNHGKILYSILDGNSAYCMNFGLRADGGQLMNSYDDASTSMSAQQRKLLSYCLYYGFNSTQKAAPSNSQCDEYIATTMLANSEFVALLKQANTDSSKMAEVIGVSEAQLRFVTNTASGMGLIKCGSVVIPFDNQISKDTDLYRLYNTNIHEKIAEQKKREMQNNVE